MPDTNQNNDPFSQPPVVGTEEKIPHSGEPVRREFDNTELGAFHNPDAEDFSVPDSPALTEAEARHGLTLPPVKRGVEAPKKGKRGLAIGIAGTAAAGLAAAGAFVVAGGSENEPKANETPAATAAPSPNTPVVTDPGAPVVIENPTTTNVPEVAPVPPAPQTPETTGVSTSAAPSTTEALPENRSYGNIGIADMPLGENPITATRPNGQEITVPRLDASSPQRFGETAMAVMACYMSTGSQQCLEAFSERPEVQQILVGWRETNILPLLDNPLNKDFQFAVWDLPENPAVFEAGVTDNGNPTVELASGEVRVSRAIDPEWQGERTRLYTGNGRQIIQPITFQVDPQDPTKIIGVIWDWQLNR